MNIVIYILSIYGLAFLAKESDGPWGIIAWLRNKLMQNKYVGVFIYKLLDCWFCTGFWSGIAVYLLNEKSLHINLIILWGLAGAASCLMLDAAINKLRS